MCRGSPQPPTDRGEPNTGGVQQPEGESRAPHQRKDPAGGSGHQGTPLDWAGEATPLGQKKQPRQPNLSSRDSARPSFQSTG